MKGLKELRAFKAIVFDLDDTLYFERDYVRSGFRAVASFIERCAGISAETAFHDFENLVECGHAKDTFDQWLAGTKGSVSLTSADLVSVYRNHAPDIAPVPGIPRLLRQMRPKLKLALLTDGRLEQQQRKIEALGIAGEFDRVLLSDSLGRAYWKPSVKPYEAVLSSLDVAPGASVYVGDNPMKDFFGARSLGMATIRVRDARGLYAAAEPPTPEHAPDAIIGSLELLEETLVELGQEQHQTGAFSYGSR
jgi:putative hydrolase of the HAD superfamily